MNVQQFKSQIEELFGPLLLEFKENEEYGFCNFSLNNYERIGFATNITPEIVMQAAEMNVDLIVTHHDAWDFVYGMKERCIELLEEYNIAHFYIHLPLDYVNFGTCISLLNLLGISNIVQQPYQLDSKTVIGIGEFASPITLKQLVGDMNRLLGERVYFQNNNNKEIKRIGMITGAGNGTDQLRDAMNSNCDVYITGEKTLYTVQYAKFIKMNIIVGSHTYTEIFGVKSLAQKLQEKFKGIEILQLYEEHFEVME